MTMRQKLDYLRDAPVRRMWAIGRAALAKRLLGNQDFSETFISYHSWFYGSGVPFQLTWEGIPAIKSPLDMWNYQQLIWRLEPSLVIEFGTNRGGSAVYFSRLLAAMGGNRRVLTVDVEDGQVDSKVHQLDNIVFMRASTTDAIVLAKIAELRAILPGPVFAILDSDHSKSHVLAELRALTPHLVKGDRLVVEDTNINGHPVLPGWGDGPLEAVEAFLAERPGSYHVDRASEDLFGWSFATGGFLIRN